METTEKGEKYIVRKRECKYGGKASEKATDHESVIHIQ